MCRRFREQARSHPSFPCHKLHDFQRKLCHPMRIEPRQLPDTLPFLGDLPPLLTRLYAARGVQSEAELDKSLARLIPYQQLKGIDAAVDLLVVALEQRQRILKIGRASCRERVCQYVSISGVAVA